MFQDHPNLLQPDGSTALWRYVDLAKLLSLLERQALWFARLDTLGDPYEGIPPKPVIDDVWDYLEKLPPEERELGRKIAEHNARAFSLGGRDIIFVSYWHANDIESIAMWSLYARFDEGIAIKSSFDRFRSSFVTAQPVVHGGLVRYVDFASYHPASLNIIDWATLKRMSFEHEREFRGVLLQPSNQPGILVPVDLDRLIAGIYVSPAAASWYAELVRNLCARYDVKAEVRQSELLRHPAYLVP